MQYNDFKKTTEILISFYLSIMGKNDLVKVTQANIVFCSFYAWGFFAKMAVQSTLIIDHKKLVLTA